MRKLLIILLLPTFLFLQDFKEKDKQLHFAAGVVFGSLGYDFVYQRTKDKKKAILGGIALSTLAGLAKELADSKMYEQKFDKKDLMATSIGGITVSLTIPLFNKKK